jgi:hypothetical protein
MPRLVPHEQRIIQREIDRVKADEKKVGSNVPEPRSVLKTNIDQ